MANQNVLKYGEEILNSINKAVETGDFSNFSKEVKTSLSGAASSLNAGIGAEIKNAIARHNAEKTPFFSVKVNKYFSGIVSICKIVSGSFIAFLMSILFLVGISQSGKNSTLHDADIAGLIFCGACTLGGIALILSGKNRRKLVKDFYSFGYAVGNRAYITIQELSEKLGKAPAYIIRQIRQMKKRGYLPHAILDKDATTLMLTDEVYTEYMKSRQNAAAAADAAEPATECTYYTIDESLPEDVKSILRDGNEYLKKIRHFNDLIPDTETMSDKLYTLEATAVAIFKKLQDTPDVAGELRKFMSYYLPTTEKLLQSYVNLRNTSQSVESIKKSQKEIEDATDLINDAFVKLLNQLFESTSWDISADISVMKTMMKQDALL